LIDKNNKFYIKILSKEREKEKYIENIDKIK